MTEKPKISLFFPVYNDENTVKIVAEKAIHVLEDIAGDYEILIIDDCSPDKSGMIADQLATEYKKIRVIHHEKNLGYGSAIMTGLNNSQFEFICFTDGDDEYDISDIKKLIKLKNHYDLIITFRYVRMYSTWRIFVSRTYNILLRFLFKTRYRDISTGLRMIRKSLLHDITIQSSSPFIGAEITIKAMLKGYRVGEVGIQTFPRVFGKGASVSPSNIRKTFQDMIKVHRQIFSSSYDLPKNRSRIK
ncbi:glycosyltransferase family 2 protein [candidate division KSB1 bacterium]